MPTQPSTGANATLPVNEIFPTIQGEGKYTGTPAVFIRLQGCPVACPWCDTKHTWRVSERKRVSIEDMLAKKDASATWAPMTAQEIVGAVRKHKLRHFVITGGEPCLYDLRRLTEALYVFGKPQIETSGTHEIKVYAQSWVTVSPKVGMPGGLQVRLDALHRANEIKMPVETPQDVVRLRALLEKIGTERLTWVQPVSQGDEATALCVQACIRNNWNLSLQAHKYAGVR